VAKIGEDLAAEDEDALKTDGCSAFHSVEDAVEECRNATAESWPSGQLDLGRWLFDEG